MNNTVETKKVNGYTIDIFQDDDPINPRVDYDNIGTMVCFHRRYQLGDKDHGFKSPQEFREWCKGKKLIILPLYLFDHSGLTISTSDFGDQWDSGQVGWIFIRPSEAIKQWGKKVDYQEKALECIKAEVEEYDNYLRGNVYGYVVKSPEGKEIGSCWGFIGKTDYVIEEAMSEVTLHENEMKTTEEWIRQSFAL